MAQSTILAPLEHWAETEVRRWAGSATVAVLVACSALATVLQLGAQEDFVLTEKVLAMALFLVGFVSVVEGLVLARRRQQHQFRSRPLAGREPAAATAGSEGLADLGAPAA